MLPESFLRGILAVSEVGEAGVRSVVVVVIRSVCVVVRRGVSQEEEGPHGSGWVPLGACVRLLIMGLVLIWCVDTLFPQKPDKGIC